MLLTIDYVVILINESNLKWNYIFITYDNYLNWNSLDAVAAHRLKSPDYAWCDSVQPSSAALF